MKLIYNQYVRYSKGSSRHKKVHSVASKRLGTIRSELKWQDFCYNFGLVVMKVLFFVKAK